MNKKQEQKENKMAAKITLDDGRVFEVGQEVESDCGDRWKSFILTLDGTDYGKISASFCDAYPHKVRHIAPKTVTKVPRTMREVDEIINVKRYEWRIKTRVYSHFVGGVISRTGMNTDIGIVPYRIRNCEYRISPESEWLDLEFKEVEV